LMYYINEMIYDLLYVDVRGTERQTSATMYHSITCRTGKELGRYKEKIILRKVM
jgi:hypothetical protein